MQVLIETRMNSLKLVESKNVKKGCIGRLEGVCADFKNPTRNGRKYPLGLWKKVFNDALFKESLKNKTLFGELDHPEDRFEPLISEACVVMTDYKIDENEGLVYGGFDILDTPKGRILKSILDYGSIVGVSSRGQGDIIESGDGECVDEDSYDFACFDVVSTPAVEKARQRVTESVKKQTFTESVTKQIEDATTVLDLNVIRSVVRASDLSSSEVDSLVESIEDKCKSLQNSGEIISECVKKDNELTTIDSAKTIRENKSLYSCISSLRQKVSAYKHREKRYIESINEQNNEIDSLKEIVNKLKMFNNDSKRQVVLLNRQIRTQNESMERALGQNKTLSQKTRDLKKSLADKDNMMESSNSKYSSKIMDLTEQLNSSKQRIVYLESQLDNINESHSNEITSMDKEVTEYNELLAVAQQKLKESESKLSDLQNNLDLITEQNSTTVVNNQKLVSMLKEYQKSYLHQLSKMNGIDSKEITESIDISYTPSKIYSLVESVRNRIDRANKIGISRKGIDETGDYLVENIKQTKQGTDDSDLEGLLTRTLDCL